MSLCKTHAFEQRGQTCFFSLFLFTCKIFWMLSKRESQARESQSMSLDLQQHLTPLRWQADKHFTYWPFKTRRPIPSSMFTDLLLHRSGVCRAHALPVGNYLGYYCELNISHVYWIEYILRGSNRVLSLFVFYMYDFRINLSILQRQKCVW